MMQARILDPIQAGTAIYEASEISSDAPDARPAAAPLPTLPLEAAALGRDHRPSAIVLRNRTWNEAPTVKFVPEHFVSMPAALDMPRVVGVDWRSPLAKEHVKINATVLPLEVEGARAGTVAPEGALHWRPMLKTRAVLQVQGSSNADTRTAGGLACALLLMKVSDLIVVDRVAPNAASDSGSREAQGFGPVTHGVSFAFHPGSKQNGVQTAFAGDISKDDNGWIQKLHVQLEGADGSKHEHQLRTHRVNLESNQWMRQMLFGLTKQYQRHRSEPLTLAVTCKDGATASGVVATAMHGFECLDAFNRGDIQLKTIDDLALRLQGFVEDAKTRRSPEFARVEGESPDYRTLAQDLLSAWRDVHGSLSNNVATLYHELDAVTGAPEETAGMLPTRALPLRAEQGKPVGTGGSEPPVADPAPVATASAHPSLERAMSRFSRQFSSGSEDSGVLVDTSHGPRSMESLASLSPMRRAPDLTITEEGVEADQDQDRVETPTARTQAQAPSIRSVLASRTPELTPPRTLELPSWTLHPMQDRSVDDALQDLKDTIQHNTVPTPRPQEAVERSAVNARSTPIQHALAITASRKAAVLSDPTDLAGIPAAVRQEWAPGGSRFEACMAQAQPLVKEMTARTGVIGYLRARWNDPLTRSLDRHLDWSREVMRHIHDDLLRAAQQQPGATDEAPPVVNQAHVANLAYQTFKSLLDTQFASLSPVEQQRWRHRVSGHSQRFEVALARSRAGVEELPRRIQYKPGDLSGRLLDRDANTGRPARFFVSRPGTPDAAGASSQPRRAPDARIAAQQTVDHEWAPHWVLSLTQQVAGAGR